MENVYLYSSRKAAAEEMAKVRRCRDMIAKEKLSDSEKRNLKAQMELCLKSMRRAS